MPPTPENIQANYLRLQNDKVEALRVLELFKEELKKLQGHRGNFESEEMEEVFIDVADTVKNQIKTLGVWIEEFDVELTRIEDAVAGLASNDIDEVRKAFGTFILNDTALSVKSISMMFYDLNDILESVKQFHKD